MLNYRERNQINKEPKLFQDDIRKTIGCFFETIGCFFETIGCFFETIGCFYQQFIKTT